MLGAIRSYPLITLEQIAHYCPQPTKYESSTYRLESGGVGEFRHVDPGCGKNILEGDTQRRVQFLHDLITVMWIIYLAMFFYRSLLSSQHFKRLPSKQYPHHCKL